MDISVKDLAQMVRIMEGLKCSAEEAREIIKADKEIDRGGNPFPLTAEQEKASKDARQADRKPTVYKLDNTNGKRSKKTNADKAFLIDLLAKSLPPYAIGIEVVNAEREIVFHYNDTKYKIVLSAPRS
jgi:hypothetical protein